MKKLIFLLCSLVTLSTFSQTFDIWSKTEGIDNDININDLRFSNRSRCALDSKLPTKSAFILIDNVNPAKVLHRYSSSTMQDSKSIIKLGVEKFRYSVYKLLESISNKLLKGELPVLSGDKIESLSSTCSDSGNCSELYDYISNAWDGNSSLSFLPKDIIRNKGSNFSCHYLKKFSPLQAHLYNPKPSVSSLEELGKTVIKNSEFMSSCEDIEQQKNLKVANYQLDLLNLNDEVWNLHGHQFWSSLKIYFSWAYRYSSLQDSLSYPFEQILKSVAIEENVVFVPNGCKSIIQQSCDTKTLSMNQMRGFAQSSSAQSIFSHDMLEQIPEGPTEDLLATPITDVNTDILSLGKYEDANGWAENFRNNFTKARGFVKLKLTQSVSNLNAISSLDMNEILTEEFTQIVAKTKSNDVDSDYKKLLKDELYYTCSEFVVAASDKLSFVKEDFKILKNVTSINKLVSKLSKSTVEDFFNKYELMGKIIIKKCDSLYAKNFWDEGHEISREGYHSWYKEISLSEQVAVKTKTVNELIKFEEPLLTLAGYKNSKRKSNVICSNALNCARLYLDSIIDLYAVVQYSSALLPLTDQVQTPSMFNPMGERVSCKVYDPWRKTRATITDFFSNIASGVTFGLISTPVYLAGQVDYKKPVSFDRLVKDGKISFDPKFNKNRLKGALYVDLGNLVSLPCQISLGSSEFNPSRYYTFTGISLNSCKKKTSNDLVVSSASEMAGSSKDRAACVGCALNFESAARVLSNVNPFLRTGYFLARGVHRLYKNLKDPNDIPHSYDVNVNNVAHTYRKHGYISKKCKRKLSKGKSCFKNKCESFLVTGLNRYIKETIIASSVSSYKKNSYFKVTNCSEVISIKMRGNRKRICSGENELLLSDINIPQSCKNIIKDSL